jgi:hypothetical protein
MAVPQHGTKARSYKVVSPTIYPEYRYSFVKSMLTPGKMAGDILKAVGEGAIAVAAFAGAAFTSGATLTIGLTVLGAVMEVSTNRLRHTTAWPNSIAGPDRQDD